MNKEDLRGKIWYIIAINTDCVCPFCQRGRECPVDDDVPDKIVEILEQEQPGYTPEYHSEVDFILRQ